MVTVAELPAGFADKVLSAQSTFRSVMDAMARPGSLQKIRAAVETPASVMRGTAAIALTLFDHDTPIWLDRMMSTTPNVAKWLKFHTGAPVVAETSVCSFAVIGDTQDLPPQCDAGCDVGRGHPVCGPGGENGKIIWPSRSFHAA